MTTNSQTQPNGQFDCPDCGESLEAWQPCPICDCYDLSWWAEQTGEEPTDEHRIKRAFHSVDQVSATLPVIRERVPNLEESDDWDAEGIAHVNDALDEIESMISDVSGELAAANLELSALMEAREDDG